LTFFNKKSIYKASTRCFRNSSNGKATLDFCFFCIRQKKRKLKAVKAAIPEAAFSQ
jgi:hypothetical protein